MINDNQSEMMGRLRCLCGRTFTVRQSVTYSLIQTDGVHGAVSPLGKRGVAGGPFDTPPPFYVMRIHSL